MEHKVSNIIKIASVVVAIISMVIWYMASSTEVPSEISSHVGSFLNVSYILFAVSVAVSIIFPIMVLAQDVKKGITFFIGAGALAIIGMISYGMASGETAEGVIDSGAKIAEAGIIMFYILFVLAVAAVIISSVKKLIS